MTEPVSNGVFVPGKVNMLIIDPQVDFHEGGNLEVPGATADSNRIAKFIENCRTNITRIKFNTIKETEATRINQIFVSLDTHTLKHIGHPGYWKILDNNTTTLTPYTVFRVEDDKIKAKSEDPVTKEIIYDVVVEPVEPELFEWTKYYIKKLYEKNLQKGPPLIWPIHCIEDTEGHYIYKPLKNTLDAFPNVEYHIKGQCETAEMYSIFKSEIVYKDIKDEIIVSTISTDKIYHGSHNTKKETSKLDTPQSGNTIDIDGACLNTDFNETLFQSIIQNSNPIVICGEALSHCVNWSLRDLVEKIIENKTNGYYDTATGRLQSDKVILLINASSAVSNFEGNVVELIKFCKQNNVSIKFLSEDGNILDRRPKSYNPHADILKTLDEYFPDTKNLTGGKSGRRTRKRVQKRRSMNRRNRRKYRRTRK